MITNGANVSEVRSSAVHQGCFECQISIQKISCRAEDTVPMRQRQRVCRHQPDTDSTSHHKWFILRAECLNMHLEKEAPEKIITRWIFLICWGTHYQARGTMYIWKINYCWTLEPRKRWCAPVKKQQQCRAPLEPRGGDWPSMKRQQKDRLEVGASAQKRSTGPAGSGCQGAEGRGTFSDYNTAA